MNEATSGRSKLSEIKLRALVREHTGGDVPEADEFAPGAALAYDDAAWVYLADDPANHLGAALAWWLRQGGDALHVIADSGTGQLARRAALFDAAIDVWRADGRALVAAEPEPLPAVPAVPDDYHALRDLIVHGGADPTVEFGVLAGEVRGLEVCRVVSDVAGTRLEVGTGAHDREAFQMMHGDVPTVESLSRVVDTVAEHRRLGAAHHPLARLAAERLIRWQLVEHPSIVDATEMWSVAPPVPRINLKDAVPCVAHGVGADGDTIVAVCSSGIDLELVPFAADAFAAAEGVSGSARLVLVTPVRDRIPLIERMADLMIADPTFVSID